MRAVVWRGLVASVVLGTLLACGGLGSSSDGEIAAEAALDAADPAELARQAGNYAEAERVLNQRLKADPTDVRSWRLLGDVNFSRGQRYTQRWKENLGWAREQYVNALTVDPTNCTTWGRVAATVVAAQENHLTAASREELEALPLSTGWERCGGPAMLAIENARRPSDQELAMARQSLGRGHAEGEVLAAAAPWIAEGLARSGQIELEWRQTLLRPELAPGVAFVVLEVPQVASGIKGAKARSFKEPEWLTVRSLSGDNLIFQDRRYPARVPAQGRVKASACPGTTYKPEGPDRFPVGQCTAGGFDRTASPVYDPNILTPAGTAHYHHPSIPKAVIGWEHIAEDSVSCVGGPVGRMFEQMPSCTVAYDQAIPQTRSIPRSSGITAVSVEHAQQMVDVLRSSALWGERAAELGRGAVAPGMTYTEFVATQPVLTGCKGRGVYNHADFVEGAVEFSCTLGPWTYTFRDMTLIEIKGNAG